MNFHFSSLFSVRILQYDPRAQRPDHCSPRTRWWDSQQNLTEWVYTSGQGIEDSWESPVVRDTLDQWYSTYDSHMVAGCDWDRLLYRSCTQCNYNRIERRLSLGAAVVQLSLISIVRVACDHAVQYGHTLEKAVTQSRRNMKAFSTKDVHYYRIICWRWYRTNMFTPEVLCKLTKSKARQEI